MPLTDESDPAAADDLRVVIIGAGPAGLTAAFELSKAGHATTIFEADDIVGGISRSPERDGWRFDIGGHRFFTKVSDVQKVWHEILPPEDILVRPRLSRIYYRGKYYDYPIKPINALRNLGLIEAVRCGVSFLWVRVRPPKDQSTLEGYIVANYGWRLYHHFFATYNMKVWAVPASEISADWGAQRIKGMSLWSAVWEPLRTKLLGRRKDKAKQVTSLIEEFEYPKYGPGMMWERCRDIVVDRGHTVEMKTAITRVHHAEGRATSVTARSADGSERDVPVDHVISSMPLPTLLRAMDPEVPDDVRAAADGLAFRDFLTVAVVVPEEDGFPDNWIYIHSPDVAVGRIQNFGQWSPYLVKDGRTCLGLEYFVFEGDELWSSSDEDLVERAKRELGVLGLVDGSRVEAGYVVRMPKAYPVYDDVYRDNVDVLRQWLEANTPNVHPVGRNGMHKYNNQDHSMYTAMLTVENILGAHHDIWAVNVEEEYHEAAGADDVAPASGGTGREAPLIPRTAYATDHPLHADGDAPGTADDAVPATADGDPSGA
jgi:protoporphyrinogen oxidase